MHHRHIATTIATILQAFHAWFWCLLIFSWGAKWLNRPTPALTYLNRAVFCAYIIHLQLVWITYMLLKSGGVSYYLGLALGMLIVTVGCLFIFEIVRRARWMRPLFGIKSSSTETEQVGRIKSILFHFLSIVVTIGLMVGLGIYFGWPE